MITLSLNFDNLLGGAAKSHEKKVREIIDTHLEFPGSDKLKMAFNLKDNGASSVSFTGPKDALAEAKRLWNENVKPAADKAAAQMKKAAAQANKSIKKANADAKKAVKKASKAAKAKAPVVKAKVAPKKSPLTGAKVKAAKVKVAKKVVKKTAKKKS